MYTTSRYASIETRKKASSLGYYVARGKKTIAALAFFARKKGFSKIIIIKENSISTIFVDELGEWKYEM